MFFYPFPKKKLMVMVVTRVGANKQMEYKLVALKTKIQYLDEKNFGLHLQHSTMNNRRQPESSADTGFSSSNNFCGMNIDFLASMVMIQLDGYAGKNIIPVCITLLMSTKSHLHPFIWNMKPFNGFVGTSSLMKMERSTGNPAIHPHISGW